MNAYGNVTKILNKIKEAKTPDRFSQDYLETVLGFSGGSARPFVSLAKRIGFLNSDGTPTDIYRRFRNPAEAEQAMAEAIRIGYPELYKRNEYAHLLDKPKLEGLVMETTGLDKGATTLKAIVATFDALKTFANFELDSKHESGNPGDGTELAKESETLKPRKRTTEDRVETPKLAFSYTIQLNLPDTADVAVFNAIFRALKENLLDT
jgi:hypothetical protein